MSLINFDVLEELTQRRKPSTRFWFKVLQEMNEYE